MEEYFIYKKFKTHLMAFERMFVKPFKLSVDYKRASYEWLSPANVPESVLVSLAWNNLYLANATFIFHPDENENSFKCMQVSLATTARPNEMKSIINGTRTDIGNYFHGYWTNKRCTLAIYDKSQLSKNDIEELESETFSRKCTANINRFFIVVSHLLIRYKPRFSSINYRYHKLNIRIGGRLGQMGIKCVEYDSPYNLRPSCKKIVAKQANKNNAKIRRSRRKLIHKQ